MQSKITKDDLIVLDESWPIIRKATIKIIKDRLKDSSVDLQNMIPMRFDRDLILGNGKWGIVLGIPAIPELVMKITTDGFEWFLIEMLNQEKDFEYHPAVPFTVGTAVLNIKVDNLPLYLIVRENLRIGVPLDKFNPLTKAKRILIEDFIEPMEDIEEELASVLNARMPLSLVDVNIAYSIVSGEIRKKMDKVIAKIPQVSKDSEFFWVLDLQKKLLERGIALVDIHPNNLGMREFDIPYYVKKDEFMGRGCVVISDLGMAYGTPLFLEEGLLYKSFEEMLAHFVKILQTYSELKKTNKNYVLSLRQNPHIVDNTDPSSEMYVEDQKEMQQEYISYVYESIKIICREANSNLNNALIDPSLDTQVTYVVGKIMNLVPRMHLSAQMIEFSLKDHVGSVINGWIEKDLLLEDKEQVLSVKCLVDSIDKNIAKCYIVDEFFANEERPVAVFEIPKTDPSFNTTHETLSNYLDRNRRLGLKDNIIQYFPLQYLKKMNGVDYEIVRSY